ncbi:MAG: DNA recombination protein RmuC [Devosia sp.]|nr:DNA recombination protein RmuC [Devosia sp.]
MDKVLFSIGDTGVSLAAAAAAGIGTIALLALLLLFAAWRGARVRADEAAARGGEMEHRLADMLRLQSEMTGRMQTMAEIFSGRTSDLARLLSERIEASSHRVNQSMAETREKTEESLGKLNERLAVIDRAQSNIAELSGEIVSLQSILSNKQQRGAFGQGRMEAIVVDGLPLGGYRFQPTLSNGSRPDCVIHMPNGAPPLAVDAKFPLEAWQRLDAAQGPEELRHAGAAFRSDIGVHVKAIADKYLIVGETQDTAFMFVPSESIFAELHEHFDDVVQRAARARVVIVSPSLLMLSIQVVQALLRDVRMREQAHLIQKEVAVLLDDVRRLTERTRKLQGHFAQANGDIEEILTSTGKLIRRGERIEGLDLAEEEPRLAGE